ncbi:MAG: dihydropteroate synthase, partial [Candidatus Bipolaricaulia bacterium]
MLIIGELINSTRITVEQALQGKDEATIRRLARDQVAGGAQVLDINAATSLKNEVPDTEWLVDVVQDEFPEIRLAIDTPNPEAMIAGLKRCKNRPFLNSVTNEKSREDMF